MFEMRLIISLDQGKLSIVLTILEENLNFFIGRNLDFCLQVNCFAFSPDLEIMATGSDDGKVRVFNRPKGTLVCRLIAHTGKYSSVVQVAQWLEARTGNYRIESSNPTGAKEFVLCS